jgi:hypothetical protein
VVGGGDQASYRFRGATVENFVEFPECSLNRHLGIEPKTIPLGKTWIRREKPNEEDLTPEMIRSSSGLNWSNEWLPISVNAYSCSGQNAAKFH